MWSNEKKDDETEFVYRNQRLTPKITEKKKEKDVNLYCMAVGCDNLALLRCACDRHYCTFRVNGRDSCFRIHLKNEHKAFLCSFYEGTGCKRNSTEASLPCGRCFICSTHANGLPNLYGCKVCGCRCISLYDEEIPIDILRETGKIHVQAILSQLHAMRCSYDHFMHV